MTWMRWLCEKRLECKVKGGTIEYLVRLVGPLFFMKYKLVKIIWQDIVADVGWEDIKRSKKFPADVCTSVGYLLKKTRRRCVLASTISEGQCNNRIVIPTGCIKRIELIRSKKCSR